MSLSISSLGHGHTVLNVGEISVLYKKDRPIAIKSGTFEAISNDVTETEPVMSLFGIHANKAIHLPQIAINEMVETA